MEINLIEKQLRPQYYCEQRSKKLKLTGISPSTYYHILPEIDDDYLTEWEVQKFRTVFSENWYRSMIVPVVVFTFFYKIQPKLFRFYLLRLQFHRSFRIWTSSCMAAMSYATLCSYPWPSKTFHELITQPEPNGKYVRTLLKEKLPRQWSLISKELHRNGYNFREMNEYSDKELMPDVTNKFDNSWY